MNFNKNTLIALSIFVSYVVLLFGGCILVENTAKVKEVVVVLDAGHGGVDGGVVGVNSQKKESEINLEIVKILQKYFINAGFRVELTRDSDKGLYQSAVRNFKQQDFERRKQIIEGANAAMAISIHQNFYPSKARRGSQVFFDEKNPVSEALARSIQLSLNNGINRPKNGRNFDALKGDYYIVKCTSVPSVIVECGFLSNPIDDALLNDKIFQEELAYYIMSGALKYFVCEA